MTFDKYSPCRMMDRTINSIYLPAFTNDEELHSKNMKEYFARKDQAWKQFRKHLAATYLGEYSDEINDLVYQEASHHDVEGSYSYAATETAYARISKMVRKIEELQRNS